MMTVVRLLGIAVEADPRRPAAEAAGDDAADPEVIRDRDLHRIEGDIEMADDVDLLLEEDLGDVPEVSAAPEAALLQHA